AKPRSASTELVISWCTWLSRNELKPRSRGGVARGTRSAAPAIRSFGASLGRLIRSALLRSGRVGSIEDGERARHGALRLGVGLAGRGLAERGRDGLAAGERREA